MGLFDKIKDLFTDEEEIVEEREIEVEENKEHKLPTFMREKIEKEEQTKQIIIPEKPETISDRDLVETNHSFKFPVDFEDKDFVDTSVYSPQNILSQEMNKPKTISEIYGKKEKEKEEKPIYLFKASPIISPVYGILNKNYNKDEVDIKKEEEYEIPRASKKVDFETVRQKAFGTLADELKNNILCENCELLKEAKENGKIKEDSLVNDIMKEVEIEDSDVTIADAEDNYYDFGVSYEPKIQIDKIESTTEIKIINNNDKEPEGEKVEVKEPKTEEKIPSRRQKHEDSDISKIEGHKDESNIKVEEDIRLTDDLFDLIDSMYEKGDE